MRIEGPRISGREIETGVKTEKYLLTTAFLLPEIIIQKEENQETPLLPDRAKWPEDHTREDKSLRALVPLPLVLLGKL